MIDYKPNTSHLVQYKPDMSCLNIDDIVAIAVNPRPVDPVMHMLDIEFLRTIRIQQMQKQGKTQPTRETQYLRLFMDSREQLSRGDELSPDNLTEIVEGIRYFDRIYGSAASYPVEIALQAINTHMALKLGLDPSSDYETVDHAVLWGGYFADKAMDDPELNAHGELTTHVFPFNPNYRIKGYISRLINRRRQPPSLDKS